MPNSQSHLFSLAQLLESAEKRQSSMPPPPAAKPEDDSGLIDILAMQTRARESRLSSQTPLPVVTSARRSDADVQRTAHTDPDIAAAVAAQGKRKQRHAMIGGVAAGLALIVFAIGFASSAQAPAAPRLAAVAVPQVVAAPPPPPPPVAPTTPVAAEATAPAAPEPVAATAPTEASKPKAKAKKKKSSHASHAGPSLMKVISGGTAQ